MSMPCSNPCACCARASPSWPKSAWPASPPGKTAAGSWWPAAMTTATGKVGFLGPLINDETRRLANAAYLGARYAWEHVRGQKPGTLAFKVGWIGFWFNIPGVTSDPNQMAGSFFDQGYDVLISGLDTPEALTVAAARRKSGATVFAVPYNYKHACQGAEAACLGVPYFNWGPPFLTVIEEVADGTYKPTFDWLPPDYAALNDPDKSPVGFLEGGGLPAEAKKALETFVADLGSGKVDLYAGPLAYQDGAVFVPAGRTPTDKELWFCPQLLKGMILVLLLVNSRRATAFGQAVRRFPLLGRLLPRPAGDAPGAIAGALDSGISSPIPPRPVARGTHLR